MKLIVGAFFLSMMCAATIQAAASQIIVSIYPNKANPTSCNISPYSFEIPFTFYVTTYDCNGQLAQDTNFSMTGTGYCSGLYYFCAAVQSPSPNVTAPVADDEISGGSPSWTVLGETFNTTSGIGTPGGFGCGGRTSPVAKNIYNNPPCPPPPCSTPHNYPNCVLHCPCGGSPIVIDTKGEGFHLTSLGNGVQFRERDNDRMKQFGWTDEKYSNGWLALPRGGQVKSLADLFGNFTPQPASDHPNGFLALAYFAQRQGCGADQRPLPFLSADVCPKAWNQLRVWIDANHDGVSQNGELHTLNELGIKSISLHYRQSRRVDEFGNEFFYAANIDDVAGPKDNRCYDVFLIEGSIKK